MLSVFLYLGYKAATNINAKKRTSINAANLDAKRDSLNTVFKGAVSEYDSTLSAKNNHKKGLSYITDAEYVEYVQLKSQITQLLSANSNANAAADLQTAMEKIAQLQNRVSILQNRNIAMEADNKRLTASIQKMLEERNAMLVQSTNKSKNNDVSSPENGVVVNSRTAPAVIKFASLKAYNVSGDELQETNYVNQANKLQGNIQLQNQSNSDMFVVVENPMGEVVRFSDWDSGVFTTNDGKRKMYTIKIKNTLGESNKTFQVDLPEDSPKGNYKMYVYSKGVKAFSASKTLN
jgi:hypothetical protein